MNSLSSNELLKMKMKRVDFLHIREDEDKSDLFEDIIIDNSQAMEMAKVYADILNGTMDAYGSILLFTNAIRACVEKINKINQNLKVLEQQKTVMKENFPPDKADSEESKMPVRTGVTVWKEPLSRGKVSLESG